MGNLLAITVHAANMHDTKSGILPAGNAVKQYPSIQRFCADAGYRGTFVQKMEDELHLGVDISEKIKPHEWEKLPCGLSSAPLAGPITRASLARNMKLRFPPLKRCL